MSPGDVPPNLAAFFRAASLVELQEKRMMTVRGEDRPLLLCSHEGKLFALDNRCPHMGFPLSKGSVQEGILTCHWHHARFDLRSGCTFDLWADDAPAFEVRVNGDDIWVSRRPRQQLTPPSLLRVYDVAWSTTSGWCKRRILSRSWLAASRRTASSGKSPNLARKITGYGKTA
jgi:nitrite reductase/ring-hydroxylating ferredoxin subunit